MEKEQKKDLVKIILSAVLLIGLLLLSKRELVPEWTLLIPYAIIGFETLKEAAENILHGEIFDEEFLMALATIGAIGVGEYEEAAAVMLFYSIGEFLEDMVSDKSRDSIEALMDIRPDTATVLRDGKEETVSPESVEIGETILVRPGERIPLDGIIAEGRTTVDTSSLTGESLPVEKNPADRVLSGTINVTGLIKIRVESNYAESTVQKVMELVEHSQEKKAKAETFIAKFAKVYTPIVCAGAVLLAVLGPVIQTAVLLHSGDWTSVLPEGNGAGQAPGYFALLFGNGLWHSWIYKACSFLVVSCPCAMVVSVPLAFFGGVGAASHAGILVKGTNYLEALTKVDTLVFDKTGTLTRGTFSVLDVKPTEHCCFEKMEGVPHHDHKDCLLHLAAAVEAFSDHPIARSIVAAAESHTHHREHIGHHDLQNCFCGKASEFPCSQAFFPEHCVLNVTEVPGKGIRCIVDGMDCLVGNGKLMHDFGMEKEASFALLREDALKEPGTLIHVALGNTYMGYLRIGDSLKEDAKETLETLRLNGMKRLVMLTGDSKAAAVQIVAELDGKEPAELDGKEPAGQNGGRISGRVLDEACYAMMPGDKVSRMEEILAEEKKTAPKKLVAFVGDGINDSPVLTRADVGIAMGALGSDAAIASADVVLMDDRLSNLNTAIRIAKKTVRIAKENIWFALGIKIIILITTAFGISSMWLAVFGDVGVLILDVLNSTRAMRK